MKESEWILSLPSEEAQALSKELGLSLEFAQILVNRKICDAESAHKFLYGTLDDLYDPFLMKGMTEAVERIHRAASSREKILIFGDYDVDGILSVVILMKALKAIGAEVDYYIPDRLEEGYGIKEKHIQIAFEKKAHLVMSVDCGIKAVKFVQKANENGIDAIITDHHLPGSELPKAIAILNPKIQDSGYPNKYLAGIGVVFKLIQALYKGRKESSVLPHYLKLVSIGTIADIASLKGENRLFVKFGLKGLENVSNIGLLSLMESCGLSGREVSVGDVGFRIGPRINAAGRMGMTDMAVKLFLSDDSEECEKTVNHLNKLNIQRQIVEERIHNQALQQIRKESLDQRYKILILGSEEWHRGVIGIVASKLKDYFHRPIILFTYLDGKAYGSGRSISEISLIDCLDNNSEFLFNYGGHTLAVGCELACEDIKPFKKSINKFADLKISEEDLRRKITIDTKMSFDNINARMLENLSLLSPFGMGNPRPLFLTDDVEVAVEPKKIKGKHSKLLVKQDGRVFEALGWGRTDWAENIYKGDRISLVYTVQTSEFLGETKINLNLEDIKRSGHFVG